MEAEAGVTPASLLAHPPLVMPAIRHLLHLVFRPSRRSSGAGSGRFSLLSLRSRTTRLVHGPSLGFGFPALTPLLGNERVCAE